MKPRIVFQYGKWFVYRMKIGDIGVAVGVDKIGRGASVWRAWRDWEFRNGIMPPADLSRCPRS